MSMKHDKPLGRVAYVNARVIDPASNLDIHGGVLCEGETITDIGPGYAKAGGHYGEAEVVDCKGACLVPGLVDMRVQIREPGEEHKGTLKSAGEAAAQGGVTSLVSLPNTTPVTDDMSVVEFVARRARLLGLSKVYPYGAITKGLKGSDMAEMGMLAESGAVAFTDGIHAVASAKVMRKALTYARNYDLLLVQHAEEPSLAEGGCMNAGDLAIRMGLPGIPTVAETIMVARDVRLAEDTGGRLHFAHISTAESIDIIRRAKERGVRVTCDTAPPYFSLNELAVGDYRTFAKLSPPLRGEEDRQAIIEGIKDGTIDVIASDHAPEDEDSKRLPFAQAAFGGVGLETLLAITLELYHNKHMSLLECLKTVTCNPAKIVGLPAGRLEKGAAADFCIFDPDRGWKIDADQLASKSKNSPFDGRLAQGRCLRTVIDGRTVFEF
ncbi:Dihydroorotase [Candidatus Terasakiella magnetica]|uniref:Dihydroorotase n=1 Tax=Candidatus Terasakiella magnetica TaxID=1867952 RepID=A0A1C3RJV8_9PROT|nr:dihydroorotase [Candidatus Terasakiella magnetica]SCA57574.1 Dihydroorotase [Candidatus Terasakiella magnetica]